jgi:hypothetical protein
MELFSIEEIDLFTPDGSSLSKEMWLSWMVNFFAPKAVEQLIFGVSLWAFIECMMSKSPRNPNIVDSESVLVFILILPSC